MTDLGYVRRTRQTTILRQVGVEGLVPPDREFYNEDQRHHIVATEICGLGKGAVAMAPPLLCKRIMGTLSKANRNI